MKNAKFFSFKLGIFGGKLGKKDILDWEWGRYRTLVIGRKGAVIIFDIVELK